MTTLVPTIYAGWQTHQTMIVGALQPLSPEQLELRAAPKLRSIGQIASHMIGGRANWFHMMGEGGDAFAAYSQWVWAGQPSRTAAELIRGLETTWQVMQAAIGRWSPAEWQQTWPGEWQGYPEVITRQWVIWHLIEHDVHHGGEVSLTLGMHGLSAPDL